MLPLLLRMIIISSRTTEESGRERNSHGWITEALGVPGNTLLSAPVLRFHYHLKLANCLFSFFFFSRESVEELNWIVLFLFFNQSETMLQLNSHTMFDHFLVIAFPLCFDLHFSVWKVQMQVWQESLFFFNGTLAPHTHTHTSVISFLIWDFTGLKLGAPLISKKTKNLIQLNFYPSPKTSWCLKCHNNNKFGGNYKVNFCLWSS